MRKDSRDLTILQIVDSCVFYDPVAMMARKFNYDHRHRVEVTSRKGSKSRRLGDKAERTCRAVASQVASRDTWLVTRRNVLTGCLELEGGTRRLSTVLSGF
jgi:hypothetical protein